MLEFPTPYILPLDTNLDILWHGACFISNHYDPKWSGMLSDVSSGRYPGKASIQFYLSCV